MEEFIDKLQHNAPMESLYTHLGEAGKRRIDVEPSMTNWFRHA